MKGFFDNKEFSDSQVYQHEKLSFSIMKGVFELGVDVNFWIFFFWPFLWRKVDQLMAAYSLCSETPYVNDMKQAYIFMVLANLLEHAYTLPFEIYSTFRVEEKYGFNKTTWQTFVKDQIKTVLLVAVAYAVLLPAVLTVVAKAGSALIPALAGTVISLIIVLQLLLPTVILPIFFTFSELENEELKKKIYAEAEKTNINVNEIRVIDGSQRSSHSNAFVAGLCGARKVVVFDTLLD